MLQQNGPVTVEDIITVISNGIAFLFYNVLSSPITYLILSTFCQLCQLPNMIRINNSSAIYKELVVVYKGRIFSFTDSYYGCWLRKNGNFGPP